jgi:hypothetical protein
MATFLFRSFVNPYLYQVHHTAFYVLNTKALEHPHACILEKAMSFDGNNLKDTHGSDDIRLEI